MKKIITLLVLTLSLIFIANDPAQSSEKKNTAKKNEPSDQERVTELMEKLKNRIRKNKYQWDLSLFTDQGWKVRGSTVNGLPLIYWACGNENAANRSLVLSAVHGDEITPVHFGFRLVEWLKARRSELCHDKNYIVVAPIVNPDGFLRYRRGTRTNYHKVDLNRNFDTPDWHRLAHKKWKERTVNGQPQRRYYPGEKPATEPEIHFQKWLIEEFHPSKIMSVHAPLRFLDLDGPSTEKMKIFARSYIEAVEAMKIRLQSSTKLLKFHLYGTFPGSLGNYAGKQLGIPTITTELPTSNPHFAGKYFGDLEESTKVFLSFDFSETPRREVTQK